MRIACRNDFQANGTFSFRFVEKMISINFAMNVGSTNPISRSVQVTE